MNKTRFSMMTAAVLTIGLLTTGCQTNSTSLTPEERAVQNERRAKRITELATFDTGILLLREKNNTAANRAVLASITNELAGFMVQSNITSGDIAAYIASLPIKELRTVEGQMIAGAVLVIVDEIIGDRITVNGAILQPVIGAAIKGFGRAIQFGELNPYVPPVPKPPRVTNAVPVKAKPP